MSSYISSHANRFYTALENAYGQLPEITAADRIPAVKLAVRQQLDVNARKDKNGSRTFGGWATGGRRRTNYELRTYLTSWSGGAAAPAYGPLFQAAFGGAPLSFAGGTAASSTANGRLGFAAAHGLAPGQAVTSGGEIRFVAAIVDPNTVQLSVPFTVQPLAGAAVGRAVTYVPATELPSVAIFDYWSPGTAVQRMLCGAAVDELQIDVNGDYHEFHFSGLAQDVVDSGSISSAVGENGLADQVTFPPEPALGAFDYTIVPGNLGQAWLGTSPSRFFTITNASIVLKNSLDARTNEFGSVLPRAISPGERSVTAAFDLYSRDDDATAGLYQAARQQSPVGIMFQLGNTPGQMMGVYLKSVVPVVPEFDDSKNRLQWKFRPSRAQGTVDDEIVVAFG
jgi:hypothetical protein